MRLLPFIALSVLGACAQPTSYRPEPPPRQTAGGLPVSYESCARQRAISTPSMYDVFLDCRQYLVMHVVQMPISSQEAKAQILERLETTAMNRAQEVVTARYGGARAAQAMHTAPPPAPPAAEPSPVIVDRQPLPPSERRI